MVMAFKNGLLQILATYFQRFDHGGSVNQFVSTEFDLKQGDKIRWECGQFCGQALVISVGDTVGTNVWCTLQKIN
jgi:hypothetical protein